jgi:predicted pyridoxine 5'-phosphate oxidase superfamily flavin-nucleotide-binding protein
MYCHAYDNKSMNFEPTWHLFIHRTVLCWLATVDAHGQPNVSPKEVFAAFDENHLVIAHIASPISVRNIQQNPKVCVSLIDIFVQKGWKLLGQARYVNARDVAFHAYAKPLLAMTGDRFNIQAVLVVKVVQAHTIVAPSYRFYPDSTTESGQIESAMKAYGVRPVKLV